MNLIEKSRETVEQLLARRDLPKTYEEKRQYALDLVDMHLHEENPDAIKVSISDDNGHTAPRERISSSPPNATGGTCHDRHLSSEIEHGDNPIWS